MGGVPVLSILTWCRSLPMLLLAFALMSLSRVLETFSSVQDSGHCLSNHCFRFTFMASSNLFPVILLLKNQGTEPSIKFFLYWSGAQLLKL